MGDTLYNTYRDYTRIFKGKPWPLIQKRKNTLKVLRKTMVEFEGKISKDNPWTYSKICGISHACKNGEGDALK